MKVLSKQADKQKENINNTTIQTNNFTAFNKEKLQLLIENQKKKKQNETMSKTREELTQLLKEGQQAKKKIIIKRKGSTITNNSNMNVSKQSINLVDLKTKVEERLNTKP